MKKPPPIVNVYDRRQKIKNKPEMRDAATQTTPGRDEKRRQQRREERAKIRAERKERERLAVMAGGGSGMPPMNTEQSPDGHALQMQSLVGPPVNPARQLNASVDYPSQSTVAASRSSNHRQEMGGSQAAHLTSFVAGRATENMSHMIEPSSVGSVPVSPPDSGQPNMNPSGLQNLFFHSHNQMVGGLPYNLANNQVPKNQVMIS